MTCIGYYTFVNRLCYTSIAVYCFFPAMLGDFEQTNDCSFTKVSIMYGGASILSTRKCLYESVETIPFGDTSGDGSPRRKQVEVIEPQIATGQLTCADFTQQVKAHWFTQNRKRQPLVVQDRRLPSLRKGDSLKVGQPAPLLLGDDWSTIVLLAQEASLLPPTIKGESKEGSGSDLEVINQVLSDL